MIASFSCGLLVRPISWDSFNLDGKQIRNLRVPRMELTAVPPSALDHQLILKRCGKECEKEEQNP